MSHTNFVESTVLVRGTGVRVLLRQTYQQKIEIEATGDLFKTQGMAISEKVPWMISQLGKGGKNMLGRRECKLKFDAAKGVPGT